jgi:hypothetical protein
MCLSVDIGFDSRPSSVVSIATGYGLDVPGIESRWGSGFSAPVQTGPRAHPASCTMGTESFPRIKSGRGETLTPHSILVPLSRKGRAIPLLPLWAVRPVQSLSACTRVHFTFFFFYRFCWFLLVAECWCVCRTVMDMVTPCDVGHVYRPDWLSHLLHCSTPYYTILHCITLCYTFIKS